MNKYGITILGKNYAEKKNYVRDLAIEYQMMASESNLSYGEIFDFQCMFEELGRRYGLIREFRENAII